MVAVALANDGFVGVARLAAAHDDDVASIPALDTSELGGGAAGIADDGPLMDGPFDEIKLI